MHVGAYVGNVLGCKDILLSRYIFVSLNPIFLSMVIFIKLHVYIIIFPGETSVPFCYFPKWAPICIYRRIFFSFYLVSPPSLFHYVHSDCILISHIP